MNDTIAKYIEGLGHKLVFDSGITGVRHYSLGPNGQPTSVLIVVARHLTEAYADVYMVYFTDGDITLDLSRKRDMHDGTTYEQLEMDLLLELVSESQGFTNIPTVILTEIVHP